MENFQERINQFLSKTDTEILVYLLQWWEMDSFSENGTIRLIGTYEKAEKPDKNGIEFGFFDNIRNSNGDLLFYPEDLGRVKIRCSHRPEYQNSPLLLVEVKLADLRYRTQFKNPFYLTMDKTVGEVSNEIKELVRKKHYIEHLHKVMLGGHPFPAASLSESLKKFKIELYTKKERLIFELIQNADDFPVKETGQVDLKFIVLENNIAVIHNGREFEDTDVKAISSIGDSGKTTDVSATGYKGIGFKSVFTHSQKVFVNSAGYSFMYDKSYKKYTQFEDLYPALEVQNEFRGKYEQFANPDVIPWELMPIWIEKHHYPEEIRTIKDFFTSNVAFGLYFGKNNIKEFKPKILQLLQEPRFLLFLRNISSIKVEGLEKNINVTRVKKGLFCYLQVNETNSNTFIVPNEPVRVTIAEDDIKSLQNIDDIPPKLVSTGSFSINFAINYDNGKILPVKDSVIFTYLPTEDRNYSFPFLVNSDFVTSSNRETILSENKWNKFVFEHIGFQVFNWAKSIIQSNEPYRFSFLAAIPKRFEIEKNDIDSIKISFNKGFDKAIQETAFLPTVNGSLCKVADALVDLTGLSKIIGNELFVKIANPSKQLIDNRLENKKVLKSLGVQAFDVAELKQIFSNPAFKQVLTPQLLLGVLKFLQENNHNFNDIALLLSETNDEDLYLPSALYFQTNQADKSLLTFKTVHFLHPIINDFADGNDKFKEWLGELGVNSFVGKLFITEKILEDLDTINNAIKLNETHNKNFWNFIFKHHSKDDIAQFGGFYVLTTNKQYQLLSSCYLSDIYKPIYSVESIATQLKLSNFHFVAQYFSATSGIDDWREFFRSAKIKKSDGVEIFENEVKAFIQNNGMNITNYLPITKFVFEIFNQNRDKVAAISNFKVLTTSELQPISSCILSNDYTQDLCLTSVLPEQVLHNQINSIYLQQVSNNRQNWKEFFLRLNPKVELTSTDVVKRKVDILASTPSLVTLQNVQQVWKTILEFKDELLKTHKEKLKKIPLLLKNNTLAAPTVCYFPKEYSPSTEIEELLTKYYDYFISPSFNSISGLSYLELKIFFKQIGVEEEIRRTIIGNSYYDVSHKEHLSKFDFAKNFWMYFQQNQSLFPLDVRTFKFYVQNNASIPCLDGSVKLPSRVYSYKLKDLVNDNSSTCCIDLNETVETFLGLQQYLTVPKCFQLLNDISDSDSTINDKKIKDIYSDLLYRFSNESIEAYSKDIADFKLNGKLLSNKDTFQSTSNLFYQDVTANYLPLDESDKVIKRFGDKDFWGKFEKVFDLLSISKVTVSDFSLDASSTKLVAIELSKTLQSSIHEFAKKIDTTNFQEIENQLKSSFEKLKIYSSQNLKMACDKLNFSPIVPNYYDTSQNTIYYSGHWNSISNAKLIEYLFKFFDISEKQISKDEFVSILLNNIPVKYEMPAAAPESLKPDGSTGRFGEEFVYKELVEMFGESRVNWLNEGGESYREYDFEIFNQNNQVLYYVDAKATTTGEVSGDTVPIYIRISEWDFMQKCKDNYIIARVYNAKSPTAYVKYLKMGIKDLQEIK